LKTSVDLDKIIPMIQVNIFLML